MKTHICIFPDCQHIYFSQHHAWRYHYFLALIDLKEYWLYLHRYDEMMLSYLHTRIVLSPQPLFPNDYDATMTR